MVVTPAEQTTADPIGRARELDELGQALQHGPDLVVVTGPPGVGKSALAAAALLATRFSGRAVTCALSDADPSRGLMVALAGALGCGPTEAHVAGALEAGGIDVVQLDDADAFVAELRTLLPRWLPQRAGTRMLVTSRESPVEARPDGATVAGNAGSPPLRAHVLTLGPLGLERGSSGEPLGDAATLWIARARRAGRTEAPRAAEARAVHALLSELSGYPLAIELAASRLDVLSADTLLERLDAEPALPGHSTTARAAHRSFDAALDVSFDLLTAPERAALCAASVFAGSFAPTMHEAILGRSRLRDALDGQAPLDLVRALHRKSLVVFVGRMGATQEPRFELAPTVRRWARRKAGADLLAELRTLHARVFTELAERLADGARNQDRDALEQLALEQRELTHAVDQALNAKASSTDEERAAADGLRLVLALRPLAWTASTGLDYAPRLDRAIARASEAPRPPGDSLTNALVTRARLAGREGRWRTAEQDFALAIARAQETGDRADEVLARRFLSLLQLCRGDREAARASADVALSLARETGDPVLVAAAQISRGLVAVGLGDQDAAKLAYDEALAKSRDARDVSGEIAALIGLGVWQAEAGEPTFGRRYLQRALELDAATGGAWLQSVLIGVGVVDLAEGRDGAAQACFAEAARAAGDHGDARTQVTAHAYRGLALFASGELTEAASVLRDALFSMEELTERRHAVMCRAVLAAAEARLGNDASARAQLRSAEDGAHGPQSVRETAVVALCRVEIALAAAVAEAESVELKGALTTAARTLRAMTSRPDPVTRAAVERFVEVKVLVRALEHAMERARAVGAAKRDGAKTEPQRLVVSANGASVTLGPSTRLDLSRKQVMARIMVALARARVERPGDPLSLEALIAAGWPDQRILPRAAYNRVHVMLSRIRESGLRDVLLRSDQGYLLDPSVPVEIVDL